MKPIPTNAKERAADLKDAGAIVRASRKRGHYKIKCPKCGGYMIANRGFYRISDEDVARYGTGDVALVDVVKPNVVKAILGGGTPGGAISKQPDTYTEHAHNTWFAARGHVLTCTGTFKGPSPSSQRAEDHSSAITFPHHLASLVREHPELRALVLSELERVGLVPATALDRGMGVGTASAWERGENEREG